jgi:hypothetical protein
VISLGGDPIEVVLAISPDRIRLDSHGSNIGDWSHDECQVVTTGPDEYAIRAEGEELPFAPSDPHALATALGVELAVSPPAEVAPESHLAQRDNEGEPGRLTLVGFFLLAGVTTLLGLWAAWSLIV